MSIYTAALCRTGGNFDLHICLGDYIGTCIWRYNCYVKESTVNLNTLANYMRWKFRGSKVLRNSDTMSFLGINKDIQWIKSIIIAEFDYHLGPKSCMNSPHIKKYIESTEAGFGVM